MEETVLQEMLRRATHLALTRGKQIDGSRTKELRYQDGRLSLRLPESRVGYSTVVVALLRPASICTFGVIYNKGEIEDWDCFQPEHYEECVEIMRSLLVLEDLADV